MLELIDDITINRYVEIKKLIMRVEKLKEDIGYKEWYDNLDKLNNDELFGLLKLSDKKDDKDFCFIMVATITLNLFRG